MNHAVGVLSAYTFGQTTNATLGGTVSDATGALIPSATITATNSAIKRVRLTETKEFELRVDAINVLNHRIIRFSAFPTRTSTASAAAPLPPSAMRTTWLSGGSQRPAAIEGLRSAHV